jgi:hypothetical protein
VGDPLTGQLRAPGCPGLLAELAGQALLGGLGQHFVLPLVGELAADVGVDEHVRLLSVAGLGREGRAVD